jgi:hypothetical protein
MDQTHIFLDETGCILNEKMMPDVAITVPELEIVKNTSDINISTKKLPDLAPTNPPIPHCFLRNFRGQAPTWSFLKRLPSCIPPVLVALIIL